GLALLVIGGSIAAGPEDSVLLQRTGAGSRIVGMNKCDLASFTRCIPDVNTINASARTGEGLLALPETRLATLKCAGAEDGSLVITNARHHDLLCGAKRELDLARASIADRRSEELILAPLHNALRLLGQITGETTTEDILSEIFATFCIGK